MVTRARPSSKHAPIDVLIRGTCLSVSLLVRIVVASSESWRLQLNIIYLYNYVYVLHT